MRAVAISLCIASLAACTDEPASRLDDPNGLAAVLAEPSTARFARATAPREFRFPADHGPHPDYRHEWWYLTGNLDGADGARYGFELTLFRFALDRAGAPEPGPSRWHSDQVYAAHFTVTDARAGVFHVADRFAREALGLAGAAGDPLELWVEDWRLQRAADGGWRLAAQEPGFALQLELEPRKPIVLHGERGLSRKSAEPGNASYYYSIPRLAARGELRIGSRTVNVTGLAWLDREWGSSALAPDQSGWDWFAVQLDDGSDLMYYQLRSAEGTKHPCSAGSWIEPDGTRRALHEADVEIDVLGHWNSPRGGRYPARWRLALPQQDLVLQVEPVLADQELATWPRYWEGAVDVTGRRGGELVAGRGYVELTGYAD